MQVSFLTATDRVAVREGGEKRMDHEFLYSSRLSTTIFHAPLFLFPEIILANTSGEQVSLLECVEIFVTR